MLSLSKEAATGCVIGWVPIRQENLLTPLRDVSTSVCKDQFRRASSKVIRVALLVSSRSLDPNMAVGFNR